MCQKLSAKRQNVNMDLDVREIDSNKVSPIMPTPSDFSI